MIGMKETGRGRGRGKREETEPVLSVKDLTFTYGGSTGTPVFQGAGFSVCPGDVFCLLGPNGTGKSTLLKCITNVLRDWRGTVLLDTFDISRMSPSQIGRSIGYVPQNQVPAFPFLVRDIVIMGRSPHLNVFSSPSRKDRDIARKAMERAGVLSLADRPCTTLSGGEWQMVLIARALAQEPRIMVLDEPTSHLDLGNQVRILRVVKSLAVSGLAIVMASHFPDHAFIVATEVAILNNGRIAHKGKAEEVITDRVMRDTYGVDVRVVDVGGGIDRKACFPSLGEEALPAASLGAANGEEEQP